MKAGIITFFWSNNIGALIQSISLKEFLNNNFEKIEFDFESYTPKELIFRENKSQLKTLNPIKYIKALKKNIYLDKWKKETAELPNYDYHKENKIFDKNLYIYGSDEIWNYDNPFFQYDEYFFGSKNNKVKIAYATSIGNLNFTLKSLPEDIKKNIKSFSNIIVRDKNTCDFVNFITNKKPFIGCDPSLLITPRLLSGESSSYYNILKEDNYILLYGIFFSNKQIKEIKNYSKKNNLKIISVSYYNSWADKNFLSINPNDFIFLLKKSKIIITSMFHGIILSYKNKKNFWYSNDPYRKNKIEFFLDKFNLNKRMIDNIDSSEINYNSLQNKFDDWIDESKEKLLASIN